MHTDNCVEMLVESTMAGYHVNDGSVAFLVFDLVVVKKTNFF